MTTSNEQVQRNVGVIGLGQMGLGIARNLDRNGRLAAMWDVRAIDASAFDAQVRWSPPAQLAAMCEVVLFVVPSSREIESCLSGHDGMLQVASPEQILVDLTTSHPDDSRRLAALAAQHGRHYVDGGMTGGASGADAGRLALMLGGEAAAIDRCRPALAAIATRIFHVGPSTAGHTMKLIHNMILHTTFFATSEGCRLAERAGIDLAKAIEVLNNGNARSFITEQRFPNHILSAKFDGRSRVANLAKDLRMATDMAASMGAPGLYGPLTTALLERAMANGMAEDDFTRLYLVMDQLIDSERLRQAE